MKRNITAFDKFAEKHRALLEEAIDLYPNKLSEKDLKVFDIVVEESRKELVKNNLFTSWKPVVSFETPKDFITKTKNHIVFESYLGPNAINLLSETPTPPPRSGIRMTDAEIKDVGAAIKSQIIAIKVLRKFYDKLTTEKKEELDLSARDYTESRDSFKEELEDLEKEMNEIYGKVGSSGFLSDIFGSLQRGVGKLFGAGSMSSVNIEESISLPSEKEIQNNLLSEIFWPGIVGGLFASLVGAGVAGWKMKKRRTRIENLQKAAKDFAEENRVPPPPVPPITTPPTPSPSPSPSPTRS